MLAYIARNGVARSSSGPFARDLMVREVGFAKLQALGIKLVGAESN
jgi:hypothetical protein